MQVLRPLFRAERVLSCAEIDARRTAAGRASRASCWCASGRANGKAIFVTLEDETGIANLVLWARTFEQFRREVMSARLMVAEGYSSRKPEGVVHLMTSRVFDRTAELDRLSEADSLSPDPVRARHPRDVRILPKSRDFH